MSIEKVCIECNEELVIIPNIVEIEAQLEHANCPTCSSVIHEEKIEGWFFVQTLKAYKTEPEVCVEPMP